MTIRRRVGRKTGRSGQQDFEPAEDRLYLAFFKPYMVHSQFTRELPEHRTLADFGFPKDVYPVGRLDADSEGLLILTDDKRLNDALLNPRRGHHRTYLAQVENIPESDALEKLGRGVSIKGQTTLPARARLLDSEPDLPPREVPIRFRKAIPTVWLELILTEGKNRQVRRMTAAVGHPTLRLLRVAIGDLALDTLGIEPGQWRRLTAPEVLRLMR
ncbi:MAG: pseudouridine synthase [Candidatus Melainabacteria bacterium]|nr:pseudouridine synthase [Candidatus Melainabacteria bacterium]